MTLYSGQVSQLLQGVSQQHPKDRSDGQVGAQVNCISDIVDGLRRRPAWRVLSELSGLSTNFTLDEHTAIHSYARGDGSEEYILLFDTQGRVKVYDAYTGIAKTVNLTANSYLANADPVNNLRFHTIGDTTFVLNTTKEVAADTTTSAGLGHEGMVYCKRANYGKTYSIIIDGVERASYTTVATVTITSTTQNKQVTLSTKDVTTQLYNDLVAWGGCATIQMKDDVIHFTMASEFSLATEDGNHGNDLFAVRNQVAEFANLPLFAPKNYKIQIAGLGDGTWDNYWVEWLPDSGSATEWAGPGKWQECIAPSTSAGLDPTTMPHKIVRESDGTFTAGDPFVWGEREAGDSQTNPDPSYVGSTVTDIGSYQNRLYMLTEENIVMSRAHDHLEFYAESVAKSAADDPVDSSSSDNQITDLVHSAIFAGSLVLFSHSAQFIHPPEVPVTPDTFSVSSRSKFNMDPKVKPVVTGSNIAFPSKFGAYTNVWEYRLADITGNPVCESITRHVPKYIKGNTLQMIANTTVDYMFLRTDDSLDTIYVQQFFYKEGKRVQLAWHKWVAPNNAVIRTITLLNDRLYAIIERNSSIYLEYMDMSLPVTEGSDYELFLDHWSTGVVEDGSWIVGGNTWTSRIATVGGIDYDLYVQGTGSKNPGFKITQYAFDSGYMYCNQPSGANIVYGFQYLSSGILTNPYVKDQLGRTHTSETTIESLAFSLQRTGYIDFLVEHATSDPYLVSFNGLLLNNWQLVLGQASLLDAIQHVDVGNIRELVTMHFSSDSHLGFSIVSFEWLCRMNQRGRRSQ